MQAVKGRAPRGIHGCGNHGPGSLESTSKGVDVSAVRRGNGSPAHEGLAADFGPRGGNVDVGVFSKKLRSRPGWFCGPEVLPAYSSAAFRRGTEDKRVSTVGVPWARGWTRRALQ